MKNTNTALRDLLYDDKQLDIHQVNDLFLRISGEIKGGVSVGVKEILSDKESIGRKIDHDLGEALGLNSYRLSELARRDEVEYNALVTT